MFARRIMKFSYVQRRLRWKAAQFNTVVYTFTTVYFVHKHINIIHKGLVLHQTNTHNFNFIAYSMIEKPTTN